ncbi:MAG: hypothetical protein K0R54_593 [Clostridiaceae bacterium]|nr:hypothetical protein [Clostridiaceae bacterium]
MTVDKLIEHLQILSSRGFGNNEVVMFEQLFTSEEPYHTTVEDIKRQKATYDVSKEVIVLLR